MRYSLIGHVVKDIAPDSPQGFRWGGGVLYSGLTASQLGADVQVITCCQNFAKHQEPAPQFRWHVQDDPHTTTFDNRYDLATGIRQQRVLARASDIHFNPDLLPPSDIVHLAPLVNEIDAHQVPQFPESVWLLATPQGWMRHLDGEGRVSWQSWQDAPLLLPRLKALALSMEDVRDDMELVRHYATLCPTVLLTQGPLGSILFHAGQESHIPAFPPHKLVDLTGAGDVIAAAFFVRYYETGDPLAAAHFGAMTATLSIEHHGAEGLPTRPQVEARLHSPQH